jgi:hypothetical protein
MFPSYLKDYISLKINLLEILFIIIISVINYHEGDINIRFDTRYRFNPFSGSYKIIRFAKCNHARLYQI